MNVTRSLIAILFGSTLGVAAVAQEATPDTWMHVSASQSREVVQQELRAAQRDGTIASLGEGYTFRQSGLSGASREQVRADMAAAKLSGEYGALHAEAYAFRSPRTGTTIAKATH